MEAAREEDAEGKGPSFREEEERTRLITVSCEAAPTGRRSPEPATSSPSSGTASECLSHHFKKERPHRPRPVCYRSGQVSHRPTDLLQNVTNPLLYVWLALEISEELIGSGAVQHPRMENVPLQEGTPREAV